LKRCKIPPHTEKDNDKEIRKAKGIIWEKPRAVSEQTEMKAKTCGRGLMFIEQIEEWMPTGEIDNRIDQNGPCQV
jgi:hypothetical protein